MRGIERATRKPKVFLCGSAIGYYGTERGSAPLDKASEPGTDFLAELCVAWEAAARRAEASKVRVVSARVGIVLAADGGALEQMALPFKFFAGGAIGSGEQIVSWIHMADAVGIFLLVSTTSRFAGPST